MLIKLNDTWYVDAGLVSAVRGKDSGTLVEVYFRDGGSAAFSGTQADVERIVEAVNALRLAALPLPHYRRNGEKEC